MATTGFMGGDLQSQGEETCPIPINIALDERFELFPCRHARAHPSPSHREKTGTQAVLSHRHHAIKTHRSQWVHGGSKAIRRQLVGSVAQLLFQEFWSL